MSDPNFKAVGIDHYYAIGCSKGSLSFDMAYTSDANIAVALRNAFENTWQSHPNKRYLVRGFNGVMAVLEPYCKPHSGQHFWVSVLSSYNPMEIYDNCMAFPLRINKAPTVSDTVAVFASYTIANKVGERLMESHEGTTSMRGLKISPSAYYDYRCPVISGELLNKWFTEGRL